jgi:ABC-2 type transport system permease protein
MKRTWYIIKREYLENVRTKAFLIGIVLTPVWMGLIFLLPKLMGGPKTEHVVIIDETSELLAPLQAVLEKSTTPTFEIQVEPAAGAWEPGPEGAPSRIEALKAQAGLGEHYLVVLTPPVLEKRAAKEGEHAHGVFGPTGGSLRGAQGILTGTVSKLVTERILTERGIAQETADLIQRPATTFTPVNEEGRRANPFQAVMPFMMMILLYMGIVGISQMLISSTLEEKANRVYEVLLSSISPFQLMAGKILGICAVGLTLLTLWSGGGLVAASLQGMGDAVSGAQIGWFVVYYLLGFLMIASLMVAIGSACNTVKEAQNLMAPVSMMLALPMILAMTTLQDPNGPLATVASFIPPFTPFMMMARMAGAPAPPTWQIWATLGVLLLGTYIAIRLAARVFRVGILLYGQPPSLKQIWRWMWTAN